ncbi:MAG TPA: caspase family protein [Dongiaceae bacterium]|nr:caspase family protein [Dongiaceae bacterium]
MFTKALILSLGLLFSGCSATLKSTDIALDFKAAEKPAIGLNTSDIVVSKASFDLPDSSISNVLYETLLSESKGVVVDSTSKLLLLSLAFRFKPEFDGNGAITVLIGTASLLMPLLALVPESTSEQYRIDYAIKDTYGNVVHQRSLEGTVEGQIMGYWIGRVGAARKLSELEANFAARNAARMVLTDIDKNSEKLLAAIRAVPKRHYAAKEKTRSSVGKSDVDELPAIKAKPNKNSYAIVIGIEEYRKRLPKADFATEDARLVTDYLTKTLGYPEENVITLLNENATNVDLVKYFEKWLPNNVEKGGTVFVYYSGHGAPEPKSGSAFLVPFDGDPSFIDETGYSLKRMYAALGKLPAKEIIVALDSCFSGAGGRSVIAKGARPLVMNLQDNLVIPKNMTVISASSGDQMSSTYDEKGHGLFTYFMLKGIKNEDVTRPDGSIRFDDLFSYLKPQVERIARKQYNNEQTPQLIGVK